MNRYPIAQLETRVADLEEKLAALLKNSRQTIRTVVIDRKITQGTRSEWGRQSSELLKS